MAWEDWKWGCAEQRWAEPNPKSTPTLFRLEKTPRRGYSSFSHAWPSPSSPSTGSPSLHRTTAWPARTRVDDADHRESTTEKELSTFRLLFLLHSPSRAWQGPFLSEDTVDAASVTTTVNAAVVVTRACYRWFQASRIASLSSCFFFPWERKAS